LKPELLIQSPPYLGPKDRFFISRTGYVLLSLGLIFLFLVSLELISASCHAMGEEYTKSILSVTSYPVISLFIGLLATAMIQSSSTVTASLVAMVSANALTLEAAVPLVLGANIGTTLTGLMVSLGHLGSPKAFRRGFMTANTHVIFNLVSALLFFPLEAHWQLLSRSSRAIASHLGNWGGIAEGWFWLQGFLLLPTSKGLQGVVNAMPIMMLCLSLVLLFMCIYALTLLFRHILLQGKTGKTFSQILRKPFLSLLAGTGITAAIHSSSVTTSFCVMLAASEKIPPRKLFPFILGANLGTTVTALMAALGRSEAGLAIAVCHLLFNFAGVLIFFPFPFIRNLIVRLARETGTLAQNKPAFAFGYLMVVFFALPFLILYFFGKMNH
jgi:solute carrier family 34 (sodium-dependent phosphate cotransporter)